MSTDTEDSQVGLESPEAPEERLNLDVKIDAVGACQRHVTVTISRDDIDRYFDKAFGELMPEANVPGFRVGRAPRKLVESRFRKEVAEKVRGDLLVDSVAQLSEENKLAAISEPDLDPMAIDVPDEGPMTFEFNLEVRPEFDLPKWHGLAIQRPTHEFTGEELDERIEELLLEKEIGREVPKDGPAEEGDYVAVDITVRYGEETVHVIEEEQVRVLPVLSFWDGRLEQFDTLMKGASADDTRRATLRISDDAPNEELRGKEVTVEFEVLEVRRLELPQLTPAIVGELGDYADEGELRDDVRDRLQRQVEYDGHQEVRRQITTALVQAADWDLPPELLRRQAERELERRVLELRRSGYSENVIRAYENDLRQNSQAETARALKEHFILERIAEEEKVDETPADVEQEISLIALQLGENPRRVRARLEKSNRMDALRNQIVERKVIQKILEHAAVKDVPAQVERRRVEAVDHAAGGGEEKVIPEAHEEKEEKEAAATE